MCSTTLFLTTNKSLLAGISCNYEATENYFSSYIGTSIALQRADTDLNTATALLESLVEFLQETCEKYSDMEE